MKKVLCLCFILLIMTGCNYSGYDFVDTNYSFDKAIIKFPDGTTKEIEIKKWADADGEQITITDKNNNRYLVSSINCILIKENNK